MPRTSLQHARPSSARVAKFWSMLDTGASQPWQKTMKELTGSEKIDASAVLEYFAPLQAWLKQQNEGQACGWQVPAPEAAARPAQPARK